MELITWSIHLLVVVFLALGASSAPEIQFNFGRVQGVDKQAQTTQKPYNAYYGIPFAQPPLGNLRFRAPQPFVGSGPNVVISSNTLRDGCSQADPVNYVKFSEDCLYLNVFTPADLTNVKKVMFWVHGGAYVAGDASLYTPSRLVTDYDVIVVTTQYRLGAFGFLGVGKGHRNNGLRDQILALKWVKDNIGQFGGDPDDITIFGESAGAGSVSLLSLSPLTKGLFTKAIMQSGTALSFWAIFPNAEDALYKSATALGCSAAWYLRWFNKGLFENSIMDCIRSKSEQELLSLNPVIDVTSPPDAPSSVFGTTQEKMNEAVVKLKDLFKVIESFAPVVDGEVIPKDPMTLLADKEYLQQIGALDRAYIFGFNNNEGLALTQLLLNMGPEEVTTSPQYGREMIKSIVKPFFPISTSLTPHLLDFLEYAYLYPRDEEGRFCVQGITDLSTDVFYAIGTLYTARALTTYSDKTNVYLYLFDHYPTPNDPSGPYKGTNHGMDLVYEFDEDKVVSSYQSSYTNVPSPVDGNLADIFRGALTQFAKIGNPSRIIGEPRNWPRFDPKKEYYMALSPTPEVRQHVNAKRMSLWRYFV